MEVPVENTSALPKPLHKMGVWSLTLVTAALFLTLRNMPMMAETGLQMIFFNVVTVFAYLIPVALVSAELATGWPHNGVYHWVGAAFGTRWGFAAVWLQWIQSIFGMTSITAYIAATLAYVWNPGLAQNKFFIVGVILTVYWLATFANFKGTKFSSRISAVCVSVGVLLPTLALIGLSAYYIYNGSPVNLTYSPEWKDWIPSIQDTKNLVLFLSFIFGFVGVEVSASHAREVHNPTKNYPIAIFTAAIVGFILTLLGGLAVAVLIPAKSINPIEGAAYSFQVLAQSFHIPWLLPLAAGLIAFGAAGQVSTWVIGPVKGLFAATHDGHFFSVFKKSNAKGIPVNLLYLQAILISLISGFFLIAPNINTAFIILTNVAVVLYSSMYILMYLSAIYLRFTQPNHPRPYRVPGGNVGMGCIAGVGLLTAGACLIIGFIPAGLAGISIKSFTITMSLIIMFVIALPFIFKREKI